MPPSLHRNIHTRQIRHPHNLNNQTRPPREMLGPLPLSSLGVILLPSKAGFCPVLINGFDEIETETAVQVLGLLLVRTGRLCIFLFRLLVDETKEGEGKNKGDAHQKLINGKIIHIHPNRTPPIILISAIFLILLAQTPDSKLAPQLFLITE